MKKFIVFLIMIMLTASVFGASAFDIKWWSQETYSNLPGNTLRAWAEDMEGGSIGTGSKFYVDSGVATGGDSSGSSWTNAAATLDAGVALCTANRGDTIYVAQGHAETWTAINSADLDIAGITVIGLGTGTDRPTFTYTTATAGELVLAAVNVTIRNLVFQSGIANVVHAIEIEADADGSVIEFCEFLSGSTDAYEFVDAIQVTAAADDLIIRYNKVTETTAGAISWLDLSAGVVDNLSMYGNEIYGDYSTGVVDSTGRIQTLGYYGFNTITNLSSGDAAFYFNAAATGVIEFNRIYADALATSIDPGSMKCFENYVSIAVDQSAVVYPAPATVAGKTYATVMTATSTTDDLFDVDGGGILITSLTGIVTTQIGNVTNTIEISLDADSGWLDYDFCTAVDTDNDAAGTRYVISNVNEGVFTPLEGADAGATVLNQQLHCGEGMIIQTAGASTTGAIKWYMTWIPYEDGTTVTAQ